MLKSNYFIYATKASNNENYAFNPSSLILFRFYTIPHKIFGYKKGSLFVVIQIK